MTPRVSIVIPVYNRQSLIRECVDSALAQTIQDIEVVIVDNASTDGTWAICEEYAARDSRVKIFRNESNVGPVRNWKRAVRESTAPLCKMLFSDDTLHPKNLEWTLPLIVDPEVGVVITQFTHDREADFGGDYSKVGPEIVDARRFVMTAIARESFYLNVSAISPGAALFRRQSLVDNILEDVPSPTWHDFADHGGGIDMLTFLLTTLRYSKVALLVAPLAFFRSHSESITSSQRVPDLFNRYHQAKIWFAHEHGYQDLVPQAVAIAWVQNCIFYRRLMSLRKIRGLFFTGKPPHVGLFTCIKAIYQQRHRTLAALRRNVKQSRRQTPKSSAVAECAK